MRRLLLILSILVFISSWPVFAVEELLGDLQDETAPAVLNEELRKISSGINLKADSSTVTTNTTDIATNAADIATNVSAIAAIVPGIVRDAVFCEYTTESDISSYIPANVSIPQNDEGTEILTCAITPKEDDNVILIVGNLNVSSDVASRTVTAALFKDDDADAVKTAFQVAVDVDRVHPFPIIHWDSNVGTTSEVTYKLRLGQSWAAGSKIWINSKDGTDLFGATDSTSLLIVEFDTP